MGMKQKKYFEMKKIVLFQTGEIIAPEDKSHSVKDPKILKTFRINFFTALLL